MADQAADPDEVVEQWEMVPMANGCIILGPVCGVVGSTSMDQMASGSCMTLARRPSSHAGVLDGKRQRAPGTVDAEKSAFTATANTTHLRKLG
jgi:hypothetical protein